MAVRGTVNDSIARANAVSSPPPASSVTINGSTAQVSALNVPPLLSLLDVLWGGVETVNANKTETIEDGILGIPLPVATFDQSGNLMTVDWLGINVTALFE